MKHQCPVCDAKLEWNNDNPFRPFCSERCKNKDLIAWANEENVLAGNSIYDGVTSDDLELL